MTKASSGRDEWLCSVRNGGVEKGAEWSERSKGDSGSPRWAARRIGGNSQCF